MTPVKPAKPTVKQLADELQRAYRLISKAIPMALQLLKKGGVRSIDQRDFWFAVDGMEAHIELLDCGIQDTDDYIISDEIQHRVEELLDLAAGEEHDSSVG